MGELHLEIIVDRLMREFKVDARVGKPQVAYRETVTEEARAEGKFVRQSGGRGLGCSSCHVPHGSVTQPHLLRSDVGYSWCCEPGGRIVIQTAANQATSSHKNAATPGSPRSRAVCRYILWACGSRPSRRASTRRP